MSCVQMQLRQLEARIPALELEISKHQLVIGNSGKRIEELNARVAELSSKSGPSADEQAALIVRVTCFCVMFGCQLSPRLLCLGFRYQALKKRLGKQECALDSAKAATSQLEAEISELQRKVLEAGGNRLKQAKSKAEAANSRLNDAVHVILRVMCAVHSKHEHEL